MVWMFAWEISSLLLTCFKLILIPEAPGSFEFLVPACWIKCSLLLLIFSSVFIITLMHCMFVSVKISGMYPYITALITLLYVSVMNCVFVILHIHFRCSTKVTLVACILNPVIIMFVLSQCVSVFGFKITVFTRVNLILFLIFILI